MRAAIYFFTPGGTSADIRVMGSWITYGLGSDNKNLPGYVLLRDASIPPGGIENFSNGFLPGTHQATHIRDEGVPVDNITPADRDARIQRAKLDTLLQQDREFLKATGGEDAVESAISNYEMGYRMQSSCPTYSIWTKRQKVQKALWTGLRRQAETPLWSSMSQSQAAGGSRR